MSPHVALQREISSSAITKILHRHTILVDKPTNFGCVQLTKVQPLPNLQSLAEVIDLHCICNTAAVVSQKCRFPV